MGCIIDCNVGMTFANSGNFEEYNKLPYGNNELYRNSEYVYLLKYFSVLVDIDNEGVKLR